MERDPDIYTYDNGHYKGRIVKGEWEYGYEYDCD
jgi:hypothetical protein